MCAAGPERHARCAASRGDACGLARREAPSAPMLPFCEGESRERTASGGRDAVCVPDSLLGSLVACISSTLLPQKELLGNAV